MKHFLTIIFMLIVRQSFCQNLVPNGSFEEYTDCPYAGGGRISDSKYWLSASKGSPDYFLPCGQDTLSHAPDNFFGYQKARSGDGYAGIYLIETNHLLPPTNYREYLTVKLTSELKAGKKYDFEMYVSLSEWSDLATKNLGVYFSDTAIVLLPYNVALPFSPQINNSTGYISDTGKWIPVNGSYVAKGGEKYIVIGNFIDDYTIDTIRMRNREWTVSRSYIYIDDVSLSASLNASEGIPDDVAIYPNPVQDEIYIRVTTVKTPLEIRFYDITSKEILRKVFTEETKLNVSGWTKGLYYFQVLDQESVIHKGKILKQ